ncbi:uncharacterized protein LOC113279489 [Papaver somniferum]|uniref:uncharacterized protein LOC113279489 n=1 Tax=Papaver somniferum TaxID=3469 RepID=UPI000E7031DC|nr:uncharacterized protein LOC113279489 [Papaver somniferum]
MKKDDWEKMVVERVNWVVKDIIRMINLGEDLTVPEQRLLQNRVKGIIIPGEGGLYAYEEDRPRRAKRARSPSSSDDSDTPLPLNKFNLSKEKAVEVVEVKKVAVVEVKKVVVLKQVQMVAVLEQVIEVDVVEVKRLQFKVAAVEVKNLELWKKLWNMRKRTIWMRLCARLRRRHQVNDYLLDFYYFTSWIFYYLRLCLFTISVVWLWIWMDEFFITLHV